MEIDIKTAVCVCQHIKTHFKQCADNEIANWGEPCTDCRYALEACKFDWLANLKPLFEKTGIAIQLGRVEHSDK